MNDVTRVLNAIQEGNDRAADELLPLVYEELRLLAARKLSQERPGHTLQATALVHEAYIRLVHGGSQNWNSRGHFFMAAAEAMRRILVEKARRKKSLRAGGGRQRVSLDEASMAVGDSSHERPSEDLVALDEALGKLERIDPKNAELVKLRYFAGLPLGQIAEIQGVSRKTATRWWTYARAWLHREITGEEEPRP